MVIMSIRLHFELSPDNPPLVTRSPEHLAAHAVRVLAKTRIGENANEAVTPYARYGIEHPGKYNAHGTLAVVLDDRGVLALYW
jgi:hypothetical protein